MNNLTVVKPAYERFWRDPWEPFFITHSDVIDYDERFRQYGYNRMSQVIILKRQRTVKLIINN